MKRRYTQMIEPLRLPPGEFCTDGSEPDWGARQRAEAQDISLTDKTPPDAVLTADVPETERLLVQYFGDIRQFALLNRDEEQVLWQRIEHLKKRICRALYTSPICLPTLQKLWHQVARGELSRGHVIAETASTADAGSAPSTTLEASILSLQKLTDRFQCLKARKQNCVANRSQVRAMRQAYADLWHQWIATCEALELQPKAHEALRSAMDVAFGDQPDDLALRAARRTWNQKQLALEEAKAQMLRANLRLVIYVAKRYLNTKVPFLDLIQEGNIGLMRALEKFEPCRGYKFVTYAYWWVRQAIGLAVIEQRRTIRLPSHVVERKNQLREVEMKLWQRHQRAPTRQELSAELGLPMQDVERLQDAGQMMVRLHEPLLEDGKRLEEVIEDEQSLDPYAVVAERELQQRMADCLSGLSEREAHILRLRFGIDADHPHTLREIAALYGLSYERIRQLETIALKKLRGAKHRALLADFVGVDNG